MVNEEFIGATDRCVGVKREEDRENMRDQRPY